MRLDREWLVGFLPRRTRARRADYARGAGGALLGILIAGAAARLVPGGSEALPYIVAPMGATAVLLFAVPASPLAQPWPVVGGNLLSTAVGITAANLVRDPLLAATIAVAAGIALMLATNCLHPPGGACALFAATGSRAVEDQGYLFILLPVAVNTVVILLVAIAVNNLTGRRYPHVPLPAPTGQAPPGQRIGVQTADVEQAITRLDQGLDIMAADVVTLLRDAETHALNRRLGQLSVAQIMAREVAVLAPFESLYRARLLLRQRDVKALPVVDAEQRVVGIVSMGDLFNRDIVELEAVSTVMTRDVVTLTEDTPVAELVTLMSDLGYRHVPIVDDQDRLVGIVTRSELIAVLNRALLGDDLRS